MIIESKSIDSESKVVGRLRYINKDEAIVYTKNMFSYPDDINSLENEFISNSKHLKNARGKNLAYSELLSLPSSNNIPKEEQVEALKKIVDEHIKLRGFQNHLAVIAIHTDTDKTHAHCLISSNSLFGTQRHRVSNKEFLKTQIQIEQFRNYSFPHFPQTNHYSQRKLEKRIKSAEGKMKYLRKAISDKERLTKTFKHSLSKSSKKEFRDFLKSKNLILYKRGAKTIGLRDISKKKNYRLETLEKGLRDKYLSYEKKLNTQLQKQRRQHNVKR